MNMLNWGVKSANFKKPEPGILQVSGLKYTIGKDNKVKDVYILNDDNSIFERLDTSPKDKEYPIIYDEFLLSGPAGFTDLKQDKSEVHMFEKGSRDTIIDYLKEHNPDYSKGRIIKE